MCIRDRQSSSAEPTLRPGPRLAPSGRWACRHPCPAASITTSTRRARCVGFLDVFGAQQVVVEPEQAAYVDVAGLGEERRPPVGSGGCTRHYPVSYTHLTLP